MPCSGQIIEGSALVLRSNKRNHTAHNGFLVWDSHHTGFVHRLYGVDICFE